MNKEEIQLFRERTERTIRETHSRSIETIKAIENEQLAELNEKIAQMLKDASDD
jgi:hypothetical protein